MRGRPLIPLLLLPIAVLLCLTACGGHGSSPAPPASPDDPKETEETEAPGVRGWEPKTVVTSGASDYTLVRPENADPDELAAAQAIYGALKDNYGVRIPFETDFVKPGVDPNTVNAAEILVGRTNRDFVTEGVYGMLGPNRFAVANAGGRILLLGDTPALTKLAAEVFIRDALNGSDYILNDEENIMIYEAEPTYQNITFHNPVCPSGADPWVIRDPDTGKYYYCYSGGNGVCVNEIADLAHITAEGGKKVYTAPENTLYS